MLSLLCIAVTVARAQDVAGSPAAPVPLVAPAVPEAAPTPYVDSTTWLGPRTPPDAGPLSSLSVGSDGTWLVGDIYGGVYVSSDKGRHWTVSLAALSSPHQDAGVADDVQKRLDEAREDASSSGDVDYEDLDLDAEDVSSEDDIQAQLGDQEDRANDGRAAEAIAHAGETGRRNARAGDDARVWWHPGAAGTAFVSRTDGLWRSTDDAGSWSRVYDTEQAHSFYAAGAGLLVVAVEDGVLFSSDLGESWIEVEVGNHAAVSGFSDSNGVLYAATDQGLYFTKNGLSWTATALDDAAVSAVVGDRAWTGGIWAVTDTGLLRSDDGGGTFREAGRQPLTGVHDLRAVGDPGHLLAWGTDGVWESVDGGVSWRPWNRGLRESDVVSLDYDDGLPVLAGPTGVWSSVPWHAPDTRGAPVDVPVNTLVYAATHRTGLDVDELSLGRYARVARLMPKLLVYGQAKQLGKRDSSIAEQLTSEDHQWEWKFGAQLCFGGCSALVDIEYNSDSVQYSVTDDSQDVVWEQDGQLWSDDEPVTNALHAANKISSYRNTLAAAVADAWTTRRQLLARRNDVASQSLGAQLDYELQLEQAEARLDFLTDGEFSRALVSPPPESP